MLQHFCDVFRGLRDDRCSLQDVPGLTSRALLPVRAHYVFLFGALSSMHELQESAAISNCQSRGTTMTHAVLVEFLIDYHSSALIQLDGRMCSYLGCCFSLPTASCCLTKCIKTGIQISFSLVLEGVSVCLELCQMVV